MTLLIGGGLRYARFRGQDKYGTVKITITIKGVLRDFITETKQLSEKPAVAFLSNRDTGRGYYFLCLYVYCSKKYL